MMRIKLIILVAICIAVQSCDDFDRIAFPIVITSPPTISTDGELSVTLDGRIQLENDFLDKIEEQGFVISTDSIYPTIENGMVIPGTATGDKSFEAFVSEGLSYNEAAYFVRAYVRVNDAKRNVVFYDPEFRAFTFNSHLRVLTITGLTQIRNDTADVTGLIDSRDFDVNELVLQYGHIFSKDPMPLVGKEGVEEFLKSTADESIQSDIVRTKARLDYNETYFFRTVAITATDTVYSDTSTFRIKGGFNKVTSIPELLSSGVASTHPDGTKAYAGIGSALYEVSRPTNQMLFDSLIWIKVPDPMDPGNDREFTGKGPWQDGLSFMANNSFYYMWGAGQGNRNIINAYSIPESEWTVRSPADIPHGQANIPLGARRDAIAFNINSTEVIFGFGQQVDPANRRNSLFKFYPVLDSIEQFCSPCLQEAHSGMFTSVIDNRIFIGTGAFGPVTNAQVSNRLFEFDPDNSEDAFKPLAPMPDDGRQNAFTFTLGDTLYVGMGSMVDELVVLPDIYFYVVSENKWVKVDTKFFPGKARTNAISFVINGRAYFGGGTDANGKALDDMWTYTPPIN